MQLLSDAINGIKFAINPVVTVSVIMARFYLDVMFGEPGLDHYFGHLLIGTFGILQK